MQFTTEKKSSALLREATERLLGLQVIVRGGGQPVKGRVLSVRVHQRRVWVSVGTHLGEFTFPADVVELA